MAKFFNEIQDIFLDNLVSIVGVETATDLSIVKIYFSIFPVHQGEKVLENLIDKKSEVRWRLGKRIGKSIRKIPELSFFIDDTAEEASRMDQIINHLNIPPEKNLNLPFFIAKKYFFSKKKKNFINVISMISMLVVGIGTMALIIVLSVFNGLEGLLRSTYGSFDPEIIVTANRGKSFVYNDDLREKIESMEAVDLIAEVIEDNVLIKYKNAQRVVRMKGVSDSFVDQGRLQNSLVYGELKLSEKDLNYAIIGRGVQYDLSINPNNDFISLQVYYPKNIGPGLTNPSKLYNSKRAIPASVFSVEKYYDENYIIVSLDFAIDLLSYNQKRTALEISLKPGQDGQKAALKLKNLIGIIIQFNREMNYMLTYLNL